MNSGANTAKPGVIFRMCLKQLPDTIQGANVRTPVHHSCEQFCSHQRRHGPHAATHEIRVWKVGQTSDGHYACRRPYYVNYMHFPKHLASVSGTKVDPSSVCASPSKRARKSRQRTWVGSRSVNTRATHRTQQASMHVPSGIRSQPHQGHPRCIYGCRRRAYSNLRSGKLQ